MPTYTIRCLECGAETDRRLTFSQYEKVQSKADQVLCETCGSEAEIAFNPGAVSFVLKEGVSGGWATKSIKENKYRERRAAHMAKRERDHVFKSTLQPNYDGVETGTWKEAQELARTEGGDLSASTYEPLVNKEVS